MKNCRLRALSDGNNVGTPPPSPGFGKYKLAEHRYGREEMLALFNPDTDPPEEIKKLTPVYVDKKQEPLALVPLSEEEQVVCLKSMFVYNLNVHLLPFLNSDLFLFCKQEF